MTSDSARLIIGNGMTSADGSILFGNDAIQSDFRKPFESDATTNMSVDAGILDAAKPEESPTLRLYRWEKPTLSIGYFQSHQDRIGHSFSSGLELVRRASGGGAIIHHHEWTYSVCVPESFAVSRGLKEIELLYQSVHQIIFDSLRSIEIDAKFRGEREGDEIANAPAVKDEPFLCFQRWNQWDGVVAGYKILGSAQRRSKGGRLQHGSLLFARSEHAPELPGVLDLRQSALTMNEPPPTESTPNDSASNDTPPTDSTPNDSGDDEGKSQFPDTQLLESRWLRQLVQCFEENWNVEFNTGRLQPKETDLAQEAAERRFANEKWTKSR